MIYCYILKYYVVYMLCFCKFYQFELMNWRKGFLEISVDWRFYYFLEVKIFFDIFENFFQRIKRYFDSLFVLIIKYLGVVNGKI